MPRFRLMSTDGDDLGVSSFSTPSWRTGDVITRGPGDQLEVVNVVQRNQDDDVDACLIVKQHDASASTP